MDKSGAEAATDDEGIRFNRFYIHKGRKPGTVEIRRLHPIISEEEARNMAAYLIFAGGGLHAFLDDYAELLEIAQP